jgi:hypothetical protein
MKSAIDAPMDDFLALREEIFTRASVESMTKRSRDLITRCAQDLIEYQEGMADAETA